MLCFHNQEYITALARRYNIKVRFISDNVIYITSSMDGQNVWEEWICYIGTKFLTLKHKHKGEKNFHFQRKFIDFEFMFNSIRNHTDFLKYQKGKSVLERKFELIANERKKYSYL